MKARVIVQEFIKEAKGADIDALVVDGHVVGAMKRQAKEGEFRSNLHRGGSAEVIELTREEEIAAIKKANALKLGVAGVDMLQSERRAIDYRSKFISWPGRYRKGNRKGHRWSNCKIHRETHLDKFRYVYLGFPSKNLEEVSTRKRWLRVFRPIKTW